MTTLSAAPGADANRGTFTLQCDVCAPPVITAQTLEQLLATGWLTTHQGHPMDVCPICARRTRADQRVRRTDAAVPEGPVRAQMPQLFVIGAEKCGTTSLHAYLDLHPDISMSWAKEAQFFQDPDAVAWRQTYLSYFGADAPVAGESSHVYTKFPLIPGVPQRMLELAGPDVRLVYLVRDPVERAISAYLEQRQHDAERRPIEVALADPGDPFHPYASNSRYATQLAQYLAVLPRDQLLVVDMAELGSDPVGVVRRVFAFAGVNPDVELPESLDPRNVGTDKREYGAAARWIRASGATRMLHRLSPERREKLLRPVRRLLTRELPRPEIPASLRAGLEAALADDAADFRKLTGLELAHWSV